MLLKGDVKILRYHLFLVANQAFDIFILNASNSFAGGDVNETNSFSTAGKHFYFNGTDVSKFARGAF
jgi:hypothetical protein